MLTCALIAFMFVPLRGRAMSLGITCGLNIDLIDREIFNFFLSKAITFFDDSMDHFSIVKNSERIPCIFLWTESTNMVLDVEIFNFSNVETIDSMCLD
jgi:hypothetical protein